MNNTTTSTLLSYHNPRVEEEEENENTCEGPCARKILYGIILASVVYRLIGPKIKIDLKVSIN